MSTYHDVMNMEFSLVRGPGGNNDLFAFYFLNPPEPEQCLELERGFLPTCDKLSAPLPQAVDPSSPSPLYGIMLNY